jgi:site-specific DNA recombinase
MENTDEILFEKFGRRAKPFEVARSSNAVIYTRVSSKEQADTNLSLHTQKNLCEQYAQKNKFSLLGCFGGTYESAKTDERKEFNRMLGFVRRSRQRISHIIVYSVDRFSRTGENAIYIASQLKKEGILVHATTSPADTSTPGGSLQQNIQFLFSQYDNDLRREKAMTGMREKLSRGYWIGVLPIGYDRLQVNKETKFVINAKGDLLRKAFYWKAEEGITNEEVRKRLESLGLTLNKQHVTKILCNVFYCGCIAHNFLDGKIIDGRHPGLVSKEIFLKANGMLLKNKFKHNVENDALPLKRFVKCGDCKTSFAGYMVKKKNIYYYKCNRKGCKCNRNANQMHDLFRNLIKQYTIEEKYIPVLKDQLEKTFIERNKEGIAIKKLLEIHLKDIEKKIETIEERFVMGEIGKEIFEKYNHKYLDEKQAVLGELDKNDFSLSNLTEYITFSLRMASELGLLWENGSYSVKEKLQYLVFPEGILYDRETADYRTERVNSVFELISCISEHLSSKEKGQFSNNSELSLSVRMKGLEPSHLAAHASETCVSTNFTTSALNSGRQR